MLALQSALLTVMTNAAKKAARGLLRDFGEVENLQVSKKGPADFVSTADRRAEQTLRDELSKARPTFGFMLEEGGVVKGKDADHVWIVDPLDGTTNFLHGLPHFAISIALAKQNEVIAGLVYDPVKDESFYAERGKGAYLNNRRLRVSARSKLDQSLLATGIPFHGLTGHDAFGRELASVMPNVAGVRRFGAASLDLAYVAAGRYEGFWERGLKPWDFAAGLLMVREAGGTITEIDGREMTLTSLSLLATNGHLHAPLQKLIAKPV